MRVYNEAARAYQRDHYRRNRQRKLDAQRDYRGQPGRRHRDYMRQWRLLRPAGDVCECGRRTGSCVPCGGTEAVA